MKIKFSFYVNSRVYLEKYGSAFGFFPKFQLTKINLHKICK